MGARQVLKLDERFLDATFENLEIRDSAAGPKP